MDFITHSLNNKTIIVIVICALSALIIALLYAFKFNIFEPFTNSYKPNSGSSREEEEGEGTSGSEGKSVEIMLFSVDWCPHCKVARPEWNKTAESTKTVKGRKVIFTDINCTDETPEVTRLIKQYNIEGYPTIKLLKDGKVFDFEAKPTEQHLKQFLEQTV